MAANMMYDDSGFGGFPGFGFIPSIIITTEGISNTFRVEGNCTFLNNALKS